MDNSLGKSLFIKCECLGHGVEIDHTEDGSDDGFTLTFWSCGRYDHTLSWGDRIRYIIHLIKTGKPWGDDVLINKIQAKQIVEYINKHLQKE